uniref:Uncharacterized protein n=1 Tax=Capra hircus TaxID=9925 RepID=A0A8C2NHQ3_CAPHI
MNFHIKQKKKKFQIHNCIPCSRTSIVSFKQKIDQQGPWWLLECGNPDQHCPSYIKSLQSPSWVLLSWLHLEKIGDSSEYITAPMQGGFY